ncbi:MAG: hypothetical protein AVDCRST_MAG53-1981, partial [uncultured Solirubrobacteraceae bacterium]
APRRAPPRPRAADHGAGRRRVRRGSRPSRRSADRLLRRAVGDSAGDAARRGVRDDLRRGRGPSAGDHHRLRLRAGRPGERARALGARRERRTGQRRQDRPRLGRAADRRRDRRDGCAAAFDQRRLGHRGAPAAPAAQGAGPRAGHGRDRAADGLALADRHAHGGRSRRRGRCQRRAARPGARRAQRGAAVRVRDRGPALPLPLAARRAPARARDLAGGGRGGRGTVRREERPGALPGVPRRLRRALRLARRAHGAPAVRVRRGERARLRCGVRVGVGAPPAGRRGPRTGRGRPSPPARVPAKAL